MNVISWTMRICLGWCQHTNTMRERRPLHGVDVLHLVCEDCGHAVPAIQRTASEHQQIVAAGAIKPARAQRAAAAAVVDLDRHRSHGQGHRRAS